MSNSSPMQKIDTAILKQINKLENSDGYQKASEAYSALEDNVQRVVKIVLMILVIAIPLLFIMILKSSNSSLLDEVNIKKDLIISSNTLIKSKNAIRRASSKQLARQFVESSDEIKKTVLGMLNLAGVDSSKVKISNVDVTPEASLITKVKADVKFDGMSNDDIFNFLKNLSQKQKIRIDELSIKKNATSNLLDGVFTMYYFSKAEILYE